MTGSPGSSGADGKAGPSVSTERAEQELDAELRLRKQPSPPWVESLIFLVIRREPVDKMDVLDPLDLLDPEDSPESWDSPDPREFL